MRGLALVVLLSLTAQATEPDDVPLAQPCLNEEQRIALARRLTTLEAENNSLKTAVSQAPSMPVVVVVVAAALVAGAAAGAAVAYTVKR